MKLLVFAVVFYLAVTGKAQDCAALANAGNCDFYTQCVEPRFQCGTNGYPLAYGDKYCRRFVNERNCFTSAGQSWIDNVTSCLMEAILSSNVYRTNGTCRELEELAFNNHSSCYTDNGFCTDILSSPMCTDMRCLAGKVFDSSDFRTKLSIQQVIKTATTCSRQEVKRFLSNADDCIANATLFRSRELLEFLKKLFEGCHSGLDMVFVLDSSESIGYSDFERMKEFVKSVLVDFEIGADKTRVGVIQFANSSDIVIKLGSINDALLLNNSITNISHTGGGRATHLALDRLHDAFINARTNEGVPRVAIVFTDGQSHSYNLTIQAAQAVHSTGIVVYSFGIGNNVDTKELKAIASDSNNVFTILNFSPSQFAAKLVPLQTSACTTPALVPISEPLTANLGMGEFRLLQYPFPDEEGITLKVYITLGQLQVHGSFTIRNPTSLTADFSITSNTSGIFFFISPELYQSSTGGLQTSRQRRQTGSPSDTTPNVYLSFEGLQMNNVFSLLPVIGKDPRTGGSCLMIKQSYSGCCRWLLTSTCFHHDCYCDECCYKFNDCCDDIIADIGCNPDCYRVTDRVDDPVTIINDLN